jgi:hypothetical protein
MKITKKDPEKFWVFLIGVHDIERGGNMSG